MPSSILENKIPHSILFPHEPLHPLPFKVFGFTCFVHNFCSGLGKLFVRSHKCVFLGFPRSQKEYKCFSSFFNRYFIYVNVTFIASYFYFKPLSSSHVPRFDKVHIPVVFDPFVVSTVTKYSKDICYSLFYQ